VKPEPPDPLVLTVLPALLARRALLARMVRKAPWALMELLAQEVTRVRQERPALRVRMVREALPVLTAQ